MNTQWHYLYPYRLYSDNVRKKNEFKLLIFDIFQKFFFQNHYCFQIDSQLFTLHC